MIGKEVKTENCRQVAGNGMYVRMAGIASEMNQPNTKVSTIGNTTLWDELSASGCSLHRGYQANQSAWFVPLKSVRRAKTKLVIEGFCTQRLTGICQ